MVVMKLIFNFKIIWQIKLLYTEPVGLFTDIGDSKIVIDVKKIPGGLQGLIQGFLIFPTIPEIQCTIKLIPNENAYISVDIPDYLA